MHFWETAQPLSMKIYDEQQEQTMTPTLPPETDAKNAVVFQAEGHPGQIEIGGALTSPAPEFHLIPTIGLVRLAERFSLGEVRKGKKAWNAMSENQDVLLNKKFIINRLGHIIGHALKLRDKIAKDLPFGDDDAGAIAWGGIFAICATDAIEKERQEKLENDTQKYCRCLTIDCPVCNKAAD